MPFSFITLILIDEEGNDQKGKIELIIKAVLVERHRCNLYELIGVFFSSFMCIH